MVWVVTRQHLLCRSGGSCRLRKVVFRCLMSMLTRAAPGNTILSPSVITVVSEIALNL